jgi:hypothetical protein
MNEILEMALKHMSIQFNDFIKECMTEDGKPKEPSYKALMKARGYLPPYCECALSKKIKEK